MQLYVHNEFVPYLDNLYKFITYCSTRSRNFPINAILLVLMTRHGKNATSSAVYSYSERRKDAKESGYGTLHERLGADSIKPFDCCSLTLQPCREPLITPQGYIFDREAILNYILDQKNAYKRKLKIWEQQNKNEQEKMDTALKKKEDEMKEKFISMESTPTHNSNNSSKSKPGSKRQADNQLFHQQPPSKAIHQIKEDEGSISNIAGSKAKEWRSFWVPELHPTAEATKLEKPSDKILCPITGEPLKFKELLPVKFTPINDDDSFNKLIGKKERYMCPVTRDILTNSSRCAYLKSSHTIVSMDCVEKIIRRDMVDPLSGKRLNDSDIIELERGGTGFAATNDVKAKLIRPQLELQ